MSKPMAREIARNRSGDGNEHHQSAKEGMTSLDEWQRRVGHALRNLGDRIVLNRSPLARLAYVERLAKERYSDHILPRGLALREVLIFCVEVIVRDLANEPAMSRACEYLVLLKEGLSCQQISRELGLSREHVSRVYRRKAFELLAEQFICVIKRGEPKQ
jgi:DNA-binding NarL/FixJ family response regulator